MKETGWLFVSILLSNAILAGLESVTGIWPFYIRAMFMLGCASTYVWMKGRLT